MTPTPEREGNNFNLLRLVLATLVLLGHSYELVDGHRQREPLTRLFGTLSLGELAVDAFFLISGYLIVQSWRQGPDLRRYLAARILRIYPGFIVVSLACILVVGPIGAQTGAYFGQLSWPQATLGVLTLRGPVIPPVFDGTHYAYVNNSLWTIKYEFACYLLVAAVGSLGWLRTGRFWAGLAISALLAFTTYTVLRRWAPAMVPDLAGPLHDGLRFLAFFGMGGLVQVAGHRLRWSARHALIALAGLIVLMHFKALAEPALATLGACVLFWLAFWQHPWVLRMGPREDISYGLYLYGWPIQKLLLWFWPGLQGLEVFLLALAPCCILGLLSWRLVERPAMRMRRRFAR